MFNKNRKISTKNLYLLELVEVTNTEFIPGETFLTSQKSYDEKSLNIFVLGRKNRLLQLIIMNILKMFLLVLLMKCIMMILLKMEW